MGDNVNTSTKEDVFVDSFPELLNSIRTNSPKARVVCVGIWFNHATVKSIMIENCAKYGCEFVDISALNTAANQAVEGATVTYRDGTTGTIAAAWATHPGDNGMMAIGDMVIDALNM